MKSILGC